MDLSKTTDSIKYLSLVGKCWSLWIEPEKGTEEGEIDDRSEGRKVEVGRQVDQAKAVGDATDQFKTSGPL